MESTTDIEGSPKEEEQQTLDLSDVSEGDSAEGMKTPPLRAAQVLRQDYGPPGTRAERLGNRNSRSRDRSEAQDMAELASAIITMRPISATSTIREPPEYWRPSSASYRSLQRAPSRFTTVDRDSCRNIDHGKSIAHRPQSAMASLASSRRNAKIKNVYGIRPAGTLFVQSKGKEFMFGNQRQHRRPDLGRQVLEQRSSLVHRIKPPADLTLFDQWLERLRGQLELQIGHETAHEIGSRWRPGSSKGGRATYLASEWQHNMAKVQTELLRRTQSHENSKD